MTNHTQLANLGWQPFFQQQLCLSEWETTVPARVTERHRSCLQLATGQETFQIPITPSLPDVTVGDWLLLDSDQRVQRRLDRKTLFKRRAAGPEAREQLIAANVDVALVVCALQGDFNLNRIERYLSLCHEAGAEPVVVLSKADQFQQSEDFRSQVQGLDPLLSVHCLDTREPEQVQALLPWCGAGTTVVMLGSSGAGKSTLTNTLMNAQCQRTGSVRAGDARGRHTTTRRSLLEMPGGALVLDTPGMRELQLTDCAQGVASTFEDIEALAAQCRFPDCQHQQEPGCAVTGAVVAGTLDARRLANYQKLVREQAHNTATLAQRRAQDRQLTRKYRDVQQVRNRQRYGD